MSSYVRRSSHLSRYFSALRLQRGLRPSQLAVRLGASNVSKIGSMIRTFELGEPISDHWFEKLLSELQPDATELIRCLELDQAEAAAQLERERLAWEAWADEPIEPFLTVRYAPGVYGVRDVPQQCCTPRESAEDWAAAELKRFRAMGFLHWTRRECTSYERFGINPRRLPVTFEDRGTGAWMQLSGSQQKFLLGSSGEVITRSHGLDQP